MTSACLLGRKRCATKQFELSGIRVVKYPPDYTLGEKYHGAGANWMMIFHYSSKVVSLVQEAKMNLAAPNHGCLSLNNSSFHVER